jgi:hypothetical protein
MRASKSSDVESSKREAAPGADQQKKKRKIEPVAVARKPAAQLEKWANKRQELKGEPVRRAESQHDVSEFADLSQMCCLLCKRKFQSVEEIQKHERISKLHKVLVPVSELTNSRLILKTIISGTHVLKSFINSTPHNLLPQIRRMPHTATVPVNVEYNLISLIVQIYLILIHELLQNRLPLQLRQRNLPPSPSHLDKIKVHSFLQRWAGPRGVDLELKALALLSLSRQRVMLRESDWEPVM